LYGDGRGGIGQMNLPWPYTSGMGSPEATYERTTMRVVEEDYVIAVESLDISEKEILNI
jgi:hypothetical protein